MRYFIAHLHRLSDEEPRGQPDREARLTSIPPDDGRSCPPPVPCCSGSTSPPRDGAAASRAVFSTGAGARARRTPSDSASAWAIAGLPRPEGPLVWFHAASVGEAASLLELFRRLQQARPTLTCLVTTVTVTSAHFVSDRLPENCIHQFVPLDVLPWVRRFLDHWRPDAAVWTESELWPAMLCETHARGIPMLLINARISDRSFRRWRMFGGVAAALLARFDRILAQDDLASRAADPARGRPRDGQRRGLAEGGRGALALRRARAAADRPGASPAVPVWLAASTHPGEEEIVLAAHARARRALPMLALILAPRHPNRGDALAEMLRGRGLAVAQRSKGEEITSDTDVYLVDTLGEMGLWYRIAAVAFVGGSLADVGGHNPFEPALLGCAILHGPHVRNFIDAYRRLAIADAAVLVRSEDELAEALVATMAPDRAATMAAAAWEVVQRGRVGDRHRASKRSAPVSTRKG